MSTLTSIAEPRQDPTATSRRHYRVSGWHVLRSEWAKLWSLRSTWITLALGLLFLLVFGLIISLQFSAGNLDSDFDTSKAVDLSLFGLPFAQLALGVLGVLVMAGEYSTGMIRSSLAAVPRRLPVLWAKAGLYGLVAALVGAVGALVAFLIGSQIVSGTSAAQSLSDSGVVRCLLGAGLYLGLIGVTCIALGALLRSVAGGISVLVGVFVLAPGLTRLLPSSWQDNVGSYLPSNAGESIYTLTPDHSALSPGAGLTVILGWTVLALAGAAYRLKRNDV
ncbi:ABC transporter permease [Streptomyces ipomoeae]|uniref:ABC transporter permease n=1 Tax=Streptomyces ipomoeae TaxID=103232 RepID=UPI00114641CA|nr:ABC transporter permease [Streptomyces ipomoeae]MDX2937204.1 ABC transporter permease [Streptomyces ipomoeae]TQE28546.1 ABC transporter permease [Streptomyces ipomoeae]